MCDRRAFYAIAVFAVAFTSIFVVSSDVSADGDSVNDEISIYVGTYLDVTNVEIKINGTEYPMDLEESEYIDGAYTGVLSVDATVGDKIVVEESEQFNGTYAIASSESSFVFLWLTNHTVTDSVLSSDDYSIELSRSDSGNDYLAQLSTVSSDSKVALSKYLIINGSEYQINSFDAKGKSMHSLVAVGLEVDAGGTVVDTTSGYDPAESDFTYSYTNQTIESVVLWNSETEMNSFLALEGIDTIWLMDVVLGAGSFAHLHNAARINMVVGGELEFLQYGDEVSEKEQHYFFQSMTWGGTNYYTNHYKIDILTDDFDFRKLHSNLPEYICQGGYYYWEDPAYPHDPNILLHQISGISYIFHANSIRAYDVPYDNSNLLPWYVADDYSMTSETTIEIDIDEATVVGDYAFSGLGVTRTTDDSWSRGLCVIGDHAFEGCTFVSTLNLDSIEDLGDEAFAGCVNLCYISIHDGFTYDGDLSSVFRGAGSAATSVEFDLPESLKDEYEWSPGSFGKVGEYTIDNVTWRILISGNTAKVMGLESTSQTELTIPAEVDGVQVTEIDSGAFKDNKAITSITSTSVTSIGSEAFSGCTGLISATFTSAQTIGAQAFAGTSISNFDLSSCINLGEGAFSGCKNLNSITLGDGLSSIPDDAFRDCPIKQLSKSKDSEEVELTLSSIGSNAFSSSTFSIGSLTVESVGSYGLGKVSIDTLTLTRGFRSGTTTIVDLQDVIVTNLVLLGTNVNIPDETFKDKTSLVTVTGSIGQVGTEAFAGCTSLTTINFESMTFIGTSAFEGCGSLTGEINLDNVTGINSKAFAGCTGLTKVTVNSGASIYYDSFDDWSVVESDIDVRESTYGDETWNYYVRAGQIVDADPNIEYIQITDDIYSIGNNAFDGCTELKVVEFSSGSDLSSIGEFAFYGCSSLESVSLPDSVTTIGQSAFNGCASLSEIGLPSGLTSISTNMLRNTTSLTSVEIPASVTGINTNAFYNSGIESLDLSALNLTSIGTGAFSGCLSLTTVVLPTGLQTLGATTGGENGVFQGCTSLTTVYVAGEEPREGFLSLPSTIKTIGLRTFQNTGFSSIEIFADVSDLNITGYAFYSISSLESVSLNNTGTISTGLYSFAYNTVLQTISFESSAGVTIGYGAFSNCPTIGTDSGGNRVALDLNDVVSLDSNAFGSCTSLSTVSIPAELTSIAYDAFRGCVMLDTFDLEEGNTTYTLVNGMLLDQDGTRIAVIPTGLTEVTIPKDVTDFASSTSAQENSNVFSLLNDLEGIAVDEDNTRYVSIDGWLAEVPSETDGDYTVLAVPAGRSSLSVSTEHDLIIPGYMFVGTEAKTITIDCGSIVLNSSSLSSDVLRNLEIVNSGDVTISMNGSGVLNSLNIEAQGNITLSSSMTVTDLSVVSKGGSITVSSGSLSGAVTAYFESDLDGSNGGLIFPDNYFGGSASTLSDLTLITGGRISVSASIGTGTLIGSSHFASGGTVTLGFDDIDGSVAVIDGVTYYIEDGKTISGISDPLGFIVDDKYGVIRQVLVDSSDSEYYLSSDIDGLRIKLSEDGKILMFTSDDNYQTWDLSVMIYRDGAWDILSPTEDGAGYDLCTTDGETSAQSDANSQVILRVEAFDAGLNDTYVTVTFDTRSSVFVPDMMVVEGRSILVSQLPEPIRSGYSFDGWFIRNDDGTYTKYEQQKITGATTLYAQWTDLDAYVDFTGSGGYFTDGSGNTVTGGYLIESDGEREVIVIGDRYYFTLAAGYEFIGFDVTSTISIEWDEGTEDGRPYVIVYSVDGYATISPSAKYYSQSSDLQQVIGVETISADEDLVLSWSFANNPVMSGMSWHNTPGTPLIVNNYVYLHLGPAIYKLNIENGNEVARADSVENGNFYYHLGYGGSGDTWYILDFATGNVFDEDLENVTNDSGAEVTMPSGMSYAKWYDGFFYTVFEGKIWKMDPNETNPDGVMINLFVPSTSEDSIVLGDIFSQYGVTSSVLIEQSVEGSPTMYWLSSSGSYRYIYAANLTTGDVSRVELSRMRGYFMDDGWLTYYDGYIYITGYTQGLFGDKGADGNSQIAYVSVDGATFGEPGYVEITGGRNSLLSNFVIVEGRGYVNATTGVSDGGDLLVYNIENHVPVFVTSVESDSSHGGIVVSTANLSSTADGLNGYVNIYMMNYSGSNYLYVFTDRVSTTGGTTTWTMDETAETKELPVGYGSQAIRVDPDGRIIFYNDSGALYCYVPESLYSDYYFLVEGDDSFEVVVGTGDDPEPLTAMEEAIWDAKRYKATYDETTNTMTYANVLRYAYYYDGEMFRPLNTCSDLDSLRFIVLLKESDYRNIDPDLMLYTTESGESGTVSSDLPILVDGVESSRATMDVGQTLQMSSVGDVSWASSDSSVVRVDQDGNVTAVSMGSAIVVASAEIGGTTVTSSCAVSVTGADLSTVAESLNLYITVGITKDRLYALSFNLDGGEVSEGTDAPSGGSYEAGTKITLPGLYTDESGENQPAITKSGYEFIGWWDGSTLYEAGSDYVILESVTLKAYWVAEDEPDITTITVVDENGNSYNNMEVTLSVSDDPLKLEASVLPASAGENITWTSDKPDVISVVNGTITALAPGTATITVKAMVGDASVQFKVTVPGYELEINETILSLAVNDSYTLEAEYELDKPLMGSVKWSSSNPAVASVDSEGNVKAITAGTAIITATAPNGNTAQCVVTVSSPQVTITGGGLMYVGDTTTLTATANGIASFQWSSSNPTVATVDQNGRVTALSEGYAVITATAGDGSGASASTMVTVQSVGVESVELNRSSLTLTVGGTQTLTATVSPDDAANKTVTWSSSNPLVASVSNAGVVTAVSAGTAVITVTTVDGSHTATCTVTVQGEVTTIVLDRTSLTIAVSETATIGATTTPTENATVTWRSSDSRIVSVDSEGNVKGVSPGTATITVSHGDISATCTVIVYEGSEAVDKGTVDNGDGTQTSTIEEIIEAGDNTIVKTTQTTTGSDGDIVSTEVTMEMTTEGSGTVTVVNIASDPTGNSTASATTTIPSTVTTSNGRQTISVSTSDVIAAAQQISSVEATSGQSVSTTVVIAAPTSGDVIDSSVTISEEAMSELYGSGDAGIRVDTGVGSVELSSDTVSEMAVAGGDVVLAVSQVFESELNDAQRSAVSDGTVFSLSASAGSTQIHQLGGTATVSLPHSLDGGRAEDVHVYYLDENGTMTEHRCSYDETTGMVTFETDYFSYYVVSNGSLIGSESSDGSSDDGLSVLLYAVIGLLAALIAMFGLNMYLTHIRGRA